MNPCISIVRELHATLGNGRLLIATDFDGTLCPIAETASRARLSPVAEQMLCAAAACDRIVPAVITGRSLADIRRWIPSGIVLAGNHGLEIAGRGLAFKHGGACELRPCIAGACDAFGPVVRHWPTAWIEDKRLSATLHFRKVHESHHKALRRMARQCLRPFGSRLALRAGKLAMEVRPSVRWDKGSAVEYIRQRTGAFAACVCIGDDATDETMFRANRDGLNIRVGRSSRTAATYRLQDPSEVATLLGHLVELCTRAMGSRPIEPGVSGAVHFGGWAGWQQ